MNEDKGGPKPDKLDQWIEQTLQNKEAAPEIKKSDLGQHYSKVSKPQTPGKPGNFHPRHRTQAQHPKSQRVPGIHNKPYPKPQSPQKPAAPQIGKPEATKKPFLGFLRRNKPMLTPKPAGAPAPVHHPHYRGKLRIIPLGGLDEVGKNCMVLEYGQDIIIIDMGFQFPEEDMLGIDYVIPDISYLKDKIHRIKGILITHGHLDHIGAIPYLLPKLNFPAIYGTKLTIGLVNKRLEEFGLEKQSSCKVITADDTLQLGQFRIEFFRVNHSIPDSVGIIVKTPAGNIVNTGDFKFDFTPSADQKPADFAKIASLSSQDIAALFIDSTNALKPGYTISEKKIGTSLESIIKNIEGRVLIASFSSQIGRIQQIIDYAKKYHRTIFLSGRSLIDNVQMATELGYLKVPQGLIHDIRRVHKIPEQKAVILTTGSQGESVSALTRMALEDHPNIKIKKGDTVVLSSSPIPGNERAVSTVTNNLSRLGARIINNQIMDVHTSGHAQQEDLKLMMSLVKAKSIVPIHGEYHMRYGNKEVAMNIGYAENNTILIENGGVIEIENGKARATGETVETNYILVDGLGVGDIGTQVMMDRQTLAENGVLIILVPVEEKSGKLRGEIDVISRGFIYMKESEELVREIKEIAKKSYQNIIEKRAGPKRGDIKKYLKESLDKYVHQKIERHPLILPVLVEK
jgi:ribonuclease J